MDGKVMDADALRAAAGFAGRPKFADQGRRVTIGN